MARKKIKTPKWRFKLRRQYATAYGPWPFQWGFFTDWWRFSLSIGKPKATIKGRLESSRFLLSCSVRPFSILAYRYDKRVLWIGDWKWKKDLWWKKDS